MAITVPEIGLVCRVSKARAGNEMTFSKVKHGIHAAYSLSLERFHRIEKHLLFNPFLFSGMPLASTFNVFLRVLD
ncbi:hypothetical protein [Rhodoferax sp.]|uniref:hypothetical protein n=1 Tax=Rhodoferax sp. TaxID=50421 RepID=UPI0025FC5E4B|nr:hypothetical protein [Rhodoferax sp.]MCM2340923.1 hypothetical protein [Rhodoferax sp.]